MLSLFFIERMFCFVMMNSKYNTIMNDKEQKKFEQQCKELIPQAPFEDIIALFENKKQQYQGSKIVLFIQKIKDKINKTKYTQFLQLGYDIERSYSYTTHLIDDMFNIALKNERADVIEYMFINDFINSMGNGFYFTNIVQSEKVLKHILANEKISHKLTPYEYGEILIRCSMYDKPECFDIVASHNIEKIKQIKPEQKTQVLLSSARFGSQTMLEKLLKLKEPISFDIEDNIEDPYALIPTKENLLILLAKNNNQDMMKYLLSSPELEKKADLGNSYWWIENLSHGKEVLEYIALNVKITVTPKLEEVLKDNVLLKVFKNKDLFLNLNEKYPEKQQKTKVKKI